MIEASLHAKHYADRALHRSVTITDHVAVARDTHRLRFQAPDIAERITPGQFLMLRLAGCDDPLIGRPLALYDVIDDDSGRPAEIDVAYLVKGKFTSRLMHLRPGQVIEAWGPLGNGFPPSTTEHMVMVAGGIGQTPFLALAREYLGLRQFGEVSRPSRAGRVTLLYGARSAAFFAEVQRFREIGVDVQLATDDGTLGRQGLVTGLLEDLLSESSQPAERGSVPPRQIVCCGPEKMMEAVAGIARDAGVPCAVSLETPMACGIGICFTCVARVRDSQGNWDYKRTCVDGPVFDAGEIVW